MIVQSHECDLQPVDRGASFPGCGNHEHGGNSYQVDKSTGSTDLVITALKIFLQGQGCSDHKQGNNDTSKIVKLTPLPVERIRVGNISGRQSGNQPKKKPLKKPRLRTQNMKFASDGLGIEKRHCAQVNASRHSNA